MYELFTAATFVYLWHKISRISTRRGRMKKGDIPYVYALYYEGYLQGIQKVLYGCSKQPAKYYEED